MIAKRYDDELMYSVQRCEGDNKYKYCTRDGKLAFKKPGTMARLKAKDCFKPKEEKADDEIDMVNHPQHYQHGIEPIDYIESHNLNFNLGNVIKYVSRAPFKGTELQDLKKAKWYLEREIKKHDN